MNNTERIELYLLGKLSETDKKSFEEELTTNLELKEELAFQKEVIAYVKQKDFVNEIGKAHQKYSDNKGFSPLWIWGGIFLLTTVLTSYFFLINSEKEHYVEHSKEVIQEEKIVIDSVITIQNQDVDSTIIQKVVLLKKVQVEKPLEEEIKEDNIESYQRKHKKAEKFIFKTNKAKEIITKSGIKLSFPANAFEGNLSTIQLEIEEYVTKSDMILADLTTLTTDKKQLESEGMLYVKATNPSTGEEVALLKNVEISFPKNANKQTDFKPFIGKENKRGEIEWELKESKSVEKAEEIFESEPMPIMSYSYSSPNLQDDIKKKLEKHIVKGERIIYSISLLSDTNFNFKNSQIKIMEFRSNNKLDSFQKKQIEEIIFNSLSQEQFKSKIIVSSDSIIYPVSQVKLTSMIFITHNNVSFSEIHMYPFFQKKEDKIQNKIDSGQKLKEREVDYYVFSLSSLGWINCDRFSSIRNRKKFTMKINNPYSNNLRLVFKKYKSILPSYQNSFQNIIEGEEVSLIGIVRVNDELKIAKTDFVTKKGYVPTLEYQSIDEKGLIEFAKGFD